MTETKLSDPVECDPEVAKRMEGITLPQALAYYASQNSDYARQFIAAAQEKSADGEVEVDNVSVIGDSEDDGEYVLAWMWVSNKEAGFEHEDEQDQGISTQATVPRLSP